MDIMKKYKYKLWKHLTKDLLKEEANEVFWRYADILNGHDLQHTSLMLNEFQNDVSYPKQVVACVGYHGSGSSALTGCLSEFGGTAGIGVTQAAALGEEGARENMGNRESDFFWRSGLFSMIDSFYDGSKPEIIDVNIRRFLAHFNTVINEGIVAGGRQGRIINQRFISSCFDFICSMFEIKEIDREKLQRGFPAILTDEEGEGKWEGLPFFHGKGKRKYLFYEPPKIDREKLSGLVTRLLTDYFSLIPGEYIIHDQLAPGDILEHINRYAKMPVKEICVSRDPRDQYVTCLRDDLCCVYPFPFPIMPRSLDDYVNFYIQRYKSFDYNYPYRMVIRFEDLVLKREETMARVAEFIGIDTSRWKTPSTSFIPENSVKNIGTYRHYHNQILIRQIEERLGQYCYYPEKQNLSPEAWELLKSSGNWE